MNQDQIKELLLKLENTELDFSVTMTGKKSKKVNGLYKPDSREILLHNKNFDEDNQLIYTAIHEYAHHLQCESDGVLRGARSHTAAFWARFHGLLEKAEAEGLYRIGVEKSDALAALTEEIRSKYLATNGKLMNELGHLLAKAQALCKDAGVRYEDYVDRVLCMPRTAAKTAVRVSSLDVNPALGYDTMKIVASQPTPERRAAAERQFTAHRSPDSVKVNLAKKAEDEDPKQRLEKEKRRLEKTIAMLRSRLDQVEQSLSNM
jgi:predicted ribosome quality control (RQC) complex YloA/Tae2 family protein